MAREIITYVSTRPYKSLTRTLRWIFVIVAAAAAVSFFWSRAALNRSHLVT